MSSTLPLIQSLQNLRNSQVLVLFFGDRPGLVTQIGSEVYDIVTQHLEQMKPQGRLSLFLYTRGGHTMTAWSSINAMRQFSDDIEIIVSSRAHSAGTLMALAANRIIMTKTASLGPIDPSLTHPLNPIAKSAKGETNIPVRVEDINGYIDLAKEELGLSKPEDLAVVLEALSDKVHPLVLGAVQRSKTQIKMLARKLMAGRLKDPTKMEGIINFLCSESGSHDYTIHMNEAASMGLSVQEATTQEEQVIKQLQMVYAKELELDKPYDRAMYLAGQPKKDYSHTRAVIESELGGKSACKEEGRLLIQQTPNQPARLNDSKTFAGWKNNQ